MGGYDAEPMFRNRNRAEDARYCCGMLDCQVVLRDGGVAPSGVMHFEGLLYNSKVLWHAVHP